MAALWVVMEEYVFLREREREMRGSGRRDNIVIQIYISFKLQSILFHKLHHSGRFL